MNRHIKTFVIVIIPIALAVIFITMAALKTQREIGMNGL